MPWARSLPQRKQMLGTLVSATLVQATKSRRLPQHAHVLRAGMAVPALACCFCLS